MKKLLSLFIVATLTLVGCSQSEEKQDVVKIGFVSDVAGIDDGSFSELTWEGIQDFAEKHDNIEIQYTTPSDTSTVELVNNIDNLFMSGNEIIVVAGYVFEEAIQKASEVYPNVDFILIDGVVEADNVASIKFAEHEAGFLAGVVSALETKTGKVAYMGGIEVPAVVAYGVGFQYGVEYAKENLGANAEIVDYVYSGTFTDFNVGQTLSAGMFDKGVDIIMATAGVATQGAIAEAKQRGDVYIVGCDSDQYSDGAMDNGNSVVLTSAMKHIDVAVATHLEYWLNDEFKGGEVITMDFQQDGVGLPIENPNLTEATIEALKEVGKALGNGTIKVPSTVEELELFLNEYDYHVEGVQY